MKIFICASKHNYYLIPPIKKELESMGHIITPPNCYDDPMKEERLKKDPKEHIAFKSERLREQERKVRINDAVLVINYEKKGQSNYIGGATFLEIFKAFELGKKIYLMNPIPDTIFTDELIGMAPEVINQDISKIPR